MKLVSPSAPTVKHEDRRRGAPKAPLFGELLIESSWRPTDPPMGASEGWLRANGFAPDRRGS